MNFNSYQIRKKVRITTRPDKTHYKLLSVYRFESSEEKEILTKFLGQLLDLGIVIPYVFTEYIRDDNDRLVTPHQLKVKDIFKVSRPLWLFELSNGHIYISDVESTCYKYFIYRNPDLRNRYKELKANKDKEGLIQLVRDHSISLNDLLDKVDLYAFISDKIKINYHTDKYRYDDFYA